MWDRTGPNTNAGVAASPEWLGSKDANSVFAAIHFKPDNNFSTIYKFDYVLNHCTPEANVAIGINTGTSTGQLLAALVNTSPNPQVLSPGTSRPAAVNNDFVTPGYQKNFDHSLTSTLHDLDRVSIKNIASYRPSYINASSQIDGLGGLVMTPQALRHRSHCPLLGASARCGRGGATTPSRLRARLGRR